MQKSLFLRPVDRISSSEIPEVLSVDYPLEHFYFNEQTQYSVIDDYNSSSALDSAEDYALRDYYDDYNVFDTNYATSWCSDSTDSQPSISVGFEADHPSSPKTVGIMPGYAETEILFFENNRAKTIEMTVNDDPSTTQTLEFTDEYEMQFFDIDFNNITKLSFKILDTYPGSKYNDTCIAEIDVWSGWVKEKDASVALAYYNDRPYLMECPTWPYSDILDGGGSLSLADPIESSEQGEHYVFSDIGIDFWLPKEYVAENFHVFKSGNSSVSFEQTDQVACTGFGDMSNPYIYRAEEGSYLITENLTEEANWIEDTEEIDFPLFHATAYTEQGLGADMITYEFKLNDNWYSAVGTFYEEDHSFDTPAAKKDPFMYSVLSSLKGF
ncbi:MAG: hypothetical protein WCT46_02500 [Candidatus Gracilibacteria bacterium]